MSNIDPKMNFVFNKLARNDYEFYLSYTNPIYKHAKHTKYICDILHKIEQGILTRVIFSMPPRHSKSETITKFFPAWYLGRNPHHEVLVCSYSTELAKTFTKITRDNLQEWGPSIFNVQIADDSQAAGQWGIKGTRGGMKAAGVNAGINGRGFSLGIIDDPVKDLEQSKNPELMEKIYEWYSSNFFTRQAPQAKIILVMTRWNDNDLAAKLIANDINNEWTVINFPAFAMEEDELGRSPGDTLWPERFDLKFYEDARRVLGNRDFQSLYQQDPTPQKGNMIKRDWFKTYLHSETLPTMNMKILSVDCTFKDGPKNDFVSIQCWGKSGPNMYLIDNVKERLDFINTVKKIKEMQIKHKTSAIYIEDKANGSAVINTLRQSMSGIIPVEPHGSKIARVSAISPQIESGNIYLPGDAIYIEDYISEWVKFPNAKHDDQVDAGSQAIYKLKDFNFTPKVKPKRDHFYDNEEDNSDWDNDLDKLFKYGN